jgi:hypothetical protein
MASSARDRTAPAHETGALADRSSGYAILMVTSSNEIQSVDDRPLVRPEEFGGLPGVAEVVGPDRQSWDATFYDTADLRLARAGITMCREVCGRTSCTHGAAVPPVLAACRTAETDELAAGLITHLISADPNWQGQQPDPLRPVCGRASARCGRRLSLCLCPRHQPVPPTSVMATRCFERVGTGGRRMAGFRRTLTKPR